MRQKSKSLFHSRLLLLLLAIDAALVSVSALIGLLIVLGFNVSWPDFWNIGRDWSAGEIFNYIKWLAISGIFASAFLHYRHPIYACLSVVFLLILADDSLQLHERSGSLPLIDVAGNLPLTQALSEVLFWFVLGLLCLGIILTVWRKTPKEIRRKLWTVLLLFSGVVASGVVVDFFHQFTGEKTVFSGVLLLLEDGGEMFFASLMLAYIANEFCFQKPDDLQPQIK